MDQVLEQFFVEKNKIYFISVLNQILCTKYFTETKQSLITLIYCITVKTEWKCKRILCP